MATLREILGVLRESYCRRIGVEYMHIQDPEERRWIQQRVEVPFAKPSRDDQLRILRRLNAAEAFETFLQTKYVGQKRFSLEGGESVIPLLDQVMTSAAENGLDEVTIGMPHRGRLNVLANIAGKSYGQIFREFEGNQDPRSVQGSGDVKYHLGYSSDRVTAHDEKVHLSLCFNPVVSLPDAMDLLAAGDAIRLLRSRNGDHPEHAQRDFWNDVIIAVSCRRRGRVLISRDQDHARIAAVVRHHVLTALPT